MTQSSRRAQKSPARARGARSACGIRPFCQSIGLLDMCRLGYRHELIEHAIDADIARARLMDETRHVGRIEIHLDAMGIECARNAARALPRIGNVPMRVVALGRVLIEIRVSDENVIAGDREPQVALLPIPGRYRGRETIAQAFLVSEPREIYSEKFEIGNASEPIAYDLGEIVLGEIAQSETKAAVRNESVFSLAHARDATTRAVSTERRRPCVRRLPALQAGQSRVLRLRPEASSRAQPGNPHRADNARRRCAASRPFP